MTEPLPEDLNAILDQRSAELDEDAFRLLQFHILAGEATGPAGPLLRMIAHIHNCYVEAKELYGTTEGEANRLFAIIEEAMSLLDRLREGEQP